MSSDELASTPLAIPDERRPSWQRWAFAAVVTGAVGAGIFAAMLRPSRVWSKTAPPPETVEVDRGDVALVVTENGTLESANNATVRCEVEALVGMTGGAVSKTAGNRGGAGGQASGGAAQAAPASPAKAAMQGKGAAAAKAGGTKARVTGAGVASKTPVPAASATAASSSVMKRPDIRSFNYIVEPHIPLRGAKPVSTQAAGKQQTNLMMGSSGGRGGGGGGGGRGGSGPTEMPGSTRIINIIPEGTRVVTGDIVCELDSAAFRDELQAQQIRYVQAQSWVEQAKSILDVNEISLREYQEGIYPQDVQLIRQYIIGCQTEQRRTRLNLAWSRDAAQKGFRANAQVRADELADLQASFVLSEAEGMEHRLKNFTMPRIMKARLAKIEAIKSDLSSQESAFALETQRLKRLELMIANCTMRAPRDGIIVYANQTNSWGRVEAQIQEGVTVRQTQPIFYVPDPRNMRVKARVNESKTSLIHKGQRVIIRIDAFPGRPLQGTVNEITPIPAPASISNLDVQVYYATVNIDSGGFDELRPGLSAEVNFLIESRREATRVPVRAIRWVDGQAYSALARKTSTGTTSWEWKAVTLGVADSTYVEVLSGLEPGDRVSANPRTLTPPTKTVAGISTEAKSLSPG
ncbi:HlyD family efflux transporter periplasmic adaptor subunit [Singulisphaera sp. Ch08]|uniref:HlyD family efflux transporter periplasmic adaptor subunit n=1 Tax=Singulisphaera sp. Ch08 TaxID=3120278 RepID=A0AAU7CMH5_9BACT